MQKNPKYGGYQRGTASMVYKFFDKKSAGNGVTNNEIKQNLKNNSSFKIQGQCLGCWSRWYAINKQA